MSTSFNAPQLLFSTEAALANGVSYNSGWLKIENWQQVQTNIISDVNGSIRIRFARDSGGVDILRTLTIPYVSADEFQTFSAPAFTPYVDYEFTPSEAGQVEFYFDTKGLKSGLSPQVLGVDSFISGQMVSTLGRSVLVGKTSGGRYNNVAIEPVTNGLEIALPRSAFGEVETTKPTPVIQTDFVYNINTDIVNTALVGTGTVTQANAMAVVSTGTTTGSTAKVSTKRFLKYRPGQGAHARGTALFTAGVAGTTQIWGAGDAVNGLFFGFNGTSFGVLHRNDSSDTWVPQTTWSGDVMDGSGSANNPSGRTLDPTKGNVFQIKFQWLGFGQIEFGVEDEVTGRFIPVHYIAYANNNTVPSFTNPSFPIMWETDNGATTSDIILKGASCTAEIEGEIVFLGPTNSIGNTKAGVTTTLTNIITIRNKSTFASKTNKAPIHVLKYSIAVEGTKPAEFELIKNTTLGGTPSYTDISVNTSLVDYDVAGTTITGGQILDFASLGKADSIAEKPKIFDIVLYPNETLTLAVKATTSTTDVTASIRWVEDI